MRSNQLSYPAIVSRLRVQRYDVFFELANSFPVFLHFFSFPFQELGLKHERMMSILKSSKLLAVYKKKFLSWQPEKQT